MIKVTPIVNADIIYRYRKQANTVIDAFTNEVLCKSNNANKLDNTIKKLNRVGMFNAKILDNNIKPHQAKLLYVLI